MQNDYNQPDEELTSDEIAPKQDRIYFRRDLERAQGNLYWFWMKINRLANTFEQIMADNEQKGLELRQDYADVLIALRDCELGAKTLGEVIQLIHDTI